MELDLDMELDPTARARGAVGRPEVQVDPSADVDASAELGRGTRVRHLAQVRERARLSEECVVGRGAYVDVDVSIGARSKVQNYALVYGPATLGPGVFVGPAAVLANDRHPRAVSPDGTPKGSGAWQALGATVEYGAAIGAGAVVLGGTRIGRWSLVGAGAVVTRGVPPHALVVGVPATRIGWVGRTGTPLEPLGGRHWRCPATGAVFLEEDGRVEEQL